MLLVLSPLYFQVFRASLIILNSLSGRLVISSSFIWSCEFLIALSFALYFSFFSSLFFLLAPLEVSVSQDLGLCYFFLLVFALGGKCWLGCLCWFLVRGDLCLCPEKQSFKLGRPASDLGSRHQILFFPSLIFSVLSQCLFWRVSWRGREATVALSGVIKTDGRGSRGLCALWLESEADTVGPLIWRPGSPQQPVSFRAGTPQARKHSPDISRHAA